MGTEQNISVPKTELLKLGMVLLPTPLFLLLGIDFLKSCGLKENLPWLDLIMIYPINPPQMDMKLLTLTQLMVLSLLVLMIPH